MVSNNECLSMHPVTAAGFLQGQHVSRLFVHDIWRITAIRISSSGQPYERYGRCWLAIFPLKGMY